MATLTTYTWAPVALSGGARPWSTAVPASIARRHLVAEPMPSAIAVKFNGTARRPSEGST